jgi:LAS superfamily LD-carboxypeptidase LdcB
VVSPTQLKQLTGQDESHLVPLACGHRLQEEAAQAFIALQLDARRAGFELAIASGYRSFARQLTIWNGKVSGARPVHDDRGQSVEMAALSASEQLHAILRYSAIPGTSRHHWGTDLDVYDLAAVPADYAVQLSPQEVAAGGVFDALHCWLDERMAAGESRGFYRPYASDRGGVAPERWHLSYAPRSTACAPLLTREVLASWLDCQQAGDQGVLLREEITAQLADIMARYIAVPDDWCPRDS